jgi:superfamily II DNA or RNA helicase
MKIVINNVQSQLLIGGSDFLVDVDLIQHLRDYMSVEVPGAYWMQKRLKWHFDGKKYFLTPGGKFATGFLPVLLRFIEETYPDLEVEIIDQRENLPQFCRVFQSKIGPNEVNEQYIHQKGLILAYDNYIKFREIKLYFPQGVCDTSTNSGKTSVIAGIYLNLTTIERILIIIHRKTVYDQLVKFFKLIVPEVGQINADRYEIKPVTIGMIQTMAKHLDDPNRKKDLAQFTVLAIDECHLGGASMYAKVSVHCTGAGMRIGTSGTAFDSNNVINKMISVGILGPKIAYISKREMMDAGISCPVKVFTHLSNTILRAPVLDYTSCLETLVYKSIERVSIIGRIIKERSKIGPVLIAIDKTNHGLFLQEQLKNIGIETELTHSKDKDITRKIEAFTNGEIDALISTSVLREGVNMPLIQTIIYASGGISKVSIKQWMGRGERLHESKTEFEFHDIMDVGKYVMGHSLKRLKIYYDENLPVISDFDKKDLKRMTSIVII